MSAAYDSWHDEEGARARSRSVLLMTIRTDLSKVSWPNVIIQLYVNSRQPQPCIF